MEPNDIFNLSLDDGEDIRNKFLPIIGSKSSSGTLPNSFSDTEFLSAFKSLDVAEQTKTIEKISTNIKKAPWYDVIKAPHLLLAKRLETGDPLSSEEMVQWATEISGAAKMARGARWIWDLLSTDDPLGLKIKENPIRPMQETVPIYDKGYIVLPADQASLEDDTLPPNAQLTAGETPFDVWNNANPDSPQGNWLSDLIFGKA